MRRIHPHEQGHRYVLAARVIREAVAEGELKPGARLPSIVEMSEHFDVATMTVRRAVQILINEKVLISRPGVGIFVAAAAEAHNPLVQLARMRESLIAIEKTVTARVADLRAEIAVLEEALAIEAAR